MKLCMFSPKDRELERGWPGRIEGDRVIQLAAQTLQSFFTGGGQAREHAEYPLAEVSLRPPILHPPAVRDFYAFEQHVEAARALRGQEVPPEWYEQPVFYFSNPAAMCSARGQSGRAASSSSATGAGCSGAMWSSSRSRESASSGTPLADVAVVGAGVNGLATAWALRRAGHDAVVYEQFEVGITRG